MGINSVCYLLPTKWPLTNNFLTLTLRLAIIIYIKWYLYEMEQHFHLFTFALHLPKS